MSATAAKALERWFNDLMLTPAGWELLSHDSVWNLVRVDVMVNASIGQTVHFVVHLARWARALIG